MTWPPPAPSLADLMARVRDLPPALPFAHPDECPDGPHRGPQGPCEDLSQCPRCLVPSWAMRPAGEEIGLHADDCSLPRPHKGYCVGGGTGHAPADVVRGYWPGMDDDVREARLRHPG